MLTLSLLALTCQHAAIAQPKEEMAKKLQKAEEDTEDEELSELRERLRALEQQIDEMRQAQSAVDSEEVPLDLETQVHGFAAVKADIYEGAPLGFALDELVFTYSSNLDRKYTFYSEIAFEPAEEMVAVDVEQVQLTLQFSDAFGLFVGRLHAPHSYWAMKEFHGSYRYLPVATPEVLALEDHGGGYMPMHQTGVFANGALDMGLSRFLYIVGTSNGRSPLIGGIAQSGDWGWGKAVTGRFSIEAPSGLLMGVGGYFDLVDPGAAADTLGEFGNVLPETMTEAIGGYHIVYDSRALYFASEGYVLSQNMGDSTGGLSYGGYLLAGPHIKKTTPYINIDVLSLVPESALVAVGTEPEAENKAGIGVRHDFALRAALKFQLDAIQEVHYAESVGADGTVSYGDKETEMGIGAHMQLAAGF